MGMFNARQPRRFRPVSIYSDESRERLQKLVDEVKREQGLADPKEKKPYDTGKFNGTFINYTPRAQKHKENGTRFGWPLAIVLIMALLMIWRFLLTGNARF